MNKESAHQPLAAELSNEGCSTDDAVEAFDQFNQYLHRGDASSIIEVIDHMHAGAEITPRLRALAKLVNHVLDTTNNGTQIGLGNNTEAVWAAVFEDELHAAARHELANLQHGEAPASEAAIAAAQRKRGLCTLRVVAMLRSTHIKRREGMESNIPIASLDTAA